MISKTFSLDWSLVKISIFDKTVINPIFKTLIFYDPGKNGLGYHGNEKNSKIETPLTCLFYVPTPS